MKDCFDLTGRVAVITGASSGLGVEFAKALAYQGGRFGVVCPPHGETGTSGRRN